MHVQFRLNVLIANQAYLVGASNFFRRSCLRSRQSSRICVRCRCIVHYHKWIDYCYTLQSICTGCG